MLKRLASLLLIGSLMACASAPQAPEKKAINAGMYGDKWPLTIDSGKIFCVATEPAIGMNNTNNGLAILLEANGKIYAMNGTARGAVEEGRESASDWHLIDEIWKRDPRGVEMGVKEWRMLLAPLITDGIKLCPPK